MTKVRAVGVVCEYNPFHNGHRFHLEASRGMAEDAVIVCAMSGDFVQRGEAAMMNKFARAEAACRCGADLVVELPLPWCLCSAEGFASGAVAMLSAMGCTELSFGSETGELDTLTAAAELLLEERTARRIKEKMRADATLSYVRARQLTVEESLGEKAAVLSQANDILAIEYIKAILRRAPGMRPHAVQRRGAGHDSLEEAGALPAARRLRQVYTEGGQLDAWLPAESAAVLRREESAGRICRPAIMELLLRARLCGLEAEAFECCPDAVNGPGRRLYKALREGRGLEETVCMAADKHCTKARMRRILLCAALGLKHDYSRETPPYARLLACSGKGRDYLRQRRDMLRIPLLTRPAAVNTLDARSRELFALGASAHDLYVLQYADRAGQPLGEDWRTGPALV